MDQAHHMIKALSATMMRDGYGRPLIDPEKDRQINTCLATYQDDTAQASVEEVSVALRILTERYEHFCRNNSVKG
jgi:hypothetical protein